MKVNEIEIRGFRGIRKNIKINLIPEKSVLIYGDNGSGKSSIADAFEWFYYDKIEHLSSEEIGNKGIPAIRNIFLSNDEAACVSLNYSDSKYNSEKKLFYKKSKLISDDSNKSEDFQLYLRNSLKENLILRYKDLLKFILYTKRERLNEISDIIGFSEVSKIKNVLKKAVNDLKKEIKTKDYENRIASKQRKIMEQIGQSIFNDEQYFSAIRELIMPIKLPIEIKDNLSVESALKLLEDKTKDRESIELQISYENAIENLSNFKTHIDNIFSTYKSFYYKCLKIAKDREKLEKIVLEPLLSQGLTLLEKRLYEDDKCPLCLQDKNREELIDDLRKRLTELDIVKQEKEAMLEDINTIKRLIQNALNEIKNVLKEKSFNLEENFSLREKIKHINDSVLDVSAKIEGTDIHELDKIKSPDDLIKLDIFNVEDVISILKDKKAKIISSRKDDTILNTYSKILSLKQYYNEIKSLKKEYDIISQQQRSMELIYSEFVKKQRDGLILFLEAISRDINDLYSFMNPSENIDEIKLIPLDEEDEFVGITLQFKFHGQSESPPHKYLSESHLNCLGICLFLASVKTFNKNNKFFILDDVISSFDTIHRARFARLLVEKFSDYQIILLTHERDWFEFLSNMVKGKNWLIRKVNWNHDFGTFIEEPILDIKSRIENKIKISDNAELGNMIRKYLEKLLKDICFNLEVKVKFLFNDHNENRMAHELLSELRAKLKDRKCEIKDKLVFERLNSSLFIGNRTSHDSEFSESIEDLKMFYSDVLDFEGLFRCPKCDKLISKKYFDPVENMIRCSCGNLKYNWKK